MVGVPQQGLAATPWRCRPWGFHDTNMAHVPMETITVLSRTVVQSEVKLVEIDPGLVH